MNAERHQRLMDLLGEALEREPQSRAAWTEAACAGDQVMRHEVMRLLAKQPSAVQFLEESPLSAALGTEQFDSKSLIGEHIGLYKIIGEIGRGGMGAVFLAERDDQEFTRRVALKLIKRGMDTDFVVKRFRNERQILASLDHPNIAGLIDGGATEADLPYFIMEYVEGQPITQHANQHSLTTAERLKLFRTVCAAVQYAHQNLVIHRDLKPSNILVTKDGEPKLLDFGIAKLLDTADEGELTATAVRVMTPEYASPEQVKGERITTATDVYSLGVLLYELLTGVRPYRVKSRQLEELVKAICEQEPEKPSNPSADSGFRLAESKPTGNGQPGTNPKSAISNPKSLKGDLDNIVLKALRKDPQRRYASVEQFSEDIRRHLEGLPVSARKDTLSYRTSKFIQRNRLGVAAAAVILAVLVGGIITTSWQARVAHAERVRAERRFNDVRKLANTYMFEFYGSIKDLPGSLPARQLLIKRALEYFDSLSGEAADDRALQAELAQAYQEISVISFDVEQIMASRRRAMTIREALVAAEPRNQVYRRQLSGSYEQMSDAMKIQGDTRQELEYAQKAVEVVTLPNTPLDPDQLQELVYLYLTLGLAQDESGDTGHAIESAQKAIAIQKTFVSSGSDKEAPRVLSICYGYLSRFLEDGGNYGESLDLSTKALDLARASLSADPSNTRYRRDVAMDNLRDGRLRTKTGDPYSALQSLTASLEQFQKLSSADPEDKGHRLWLAVAYLGLGKTLAASNREKEALEDFSKAIAITEQLISADAKWREARRYLTDMYSSIGRLLAKAHETTKATDYLQKAVALAETSSNIDPQNVQVRRGLAEAYLGMASINADSSANGSAEALRKARSWYEKSLTVYQDMQSKGILGSADSVKPEELAKEIARCDAALAQK